MIRRLAGLVMIIVLGASAGWAVGARGDVVGHQSDQTSPIISRCVVEGNDPGSGQVAVGISNDGLPLLSIADISLTVGGRTLSWDSGEDGAVIRRGQSLWIRDAANPADRVSAFFSNPGDDCFVSSISGWTIGPHGVATVWAPRNDSSRCDLFGDLYLPDFC